MKYIDHNGNEFEYSDLLPCPFCGGNAELKFIGNNFTKSRKADVHCTKCRIGNINATIRHNSEWIAKITIDKWNSRCFKIKIMEPRDIENPIAEEDFRSQIRGGCRVCGYNCLDAINMETIICSYCEDISTPLTKEKLNEINQLILKSQK